MRLLKKLLLYYIFLSKQEFRKSLLHKFLIRLEGHLSHGLHVVEAFADVFLQQDGDAGLEGVRFREDLDDFVFQLLDFVRDAGVAVEEVLDEAA